MTEQTALTRADVDAAIRALVDETIGSIDHRKRRLVEAMIREALKAGRNDASRLNLKIMSRSLKELRRGFRAFEPYEDRRKVAVFGSARSEPDSDAYRMAEACARKLVEAGFMVVTGAGPGIMEAANKGAGREHSFGVNIQLPFEQDANEYIADDPKLVNFKYFFTRKVVFVKETDGVILFPGGFGTQDEGFEMMTLVQTGKTAPAPMVMVQPPGNTYWEQWHAWIRKSLLGRGLISPADLDLYRITTDIDEAVRHIEHFYRNYYSLRYIGNDLVIRLRHQPTEALVRDLNQDFEDLCETGGIRAAEEDPSEAEEELPEGLHRIRFHFRQKHFGRLRLLIDRLNDAVPAAETETAWKLRAVHEVVPISIENDNGHTMVRGVTPLEDPGAAAADSDE